MIEDQGAIPKRRRKTSAIDAEKAKPIVIQPFTSKNDTPKPWEKTYFLLPPL